MWIALSTVQAAFAHRCSFILSCALPLTIDPYQCSFVVNASKGCSLMRVPVWCSASVASRDIHKHEFAASFHPLHASPPLFFLHCSLGSCCTLLTPSFRFCCLPCRKCVHDLDEERFGLIMCLSPRLLMVVWHVWVCPRHASYYVMLCGSAVCLGSLSCKRTHFANVGLLV